MNRSTKHIVLYHLTLLFLVIYIGKGFSQTLSEFNYKVKFRSYGESWNKLYLNDIIIDELNQDFSNIRIVGIKNLDTLEQPFCFLQSTREEKTYISHKPYNFSHNDSAWYYYFQIDQQEYLNSIILNLDDNNYDYYVRIEGSFNGKDWYILRDKARILAMIDESHALSSTKVDFLNSNYSFYKVVIPVEFDPKLLNVTFNKEGKYVIGKREITPISRSVIINKKQKNTQHDFYFKYSVPVDEFIISTTTSEYNRFVDVYCKIDSVLIKKNWHPLFRLVSKVKITSNKQNKIVLPKFKTNHVRLIVYDEDNLPLNNASFNFFGDSIALITRLEKCDSYYLIYGGPTTVKPYYDIIHFADKHFFTTNVIQLEFIQKIKPLISDKKEHVWHLWLIMLIIILILLYFTVKMFIRIKHQHE